jgi:gas vesicle protein
MRRADRELAFFLTGAVVGTAIGLLYAPEKGKLLRDRLSYKLDTYRDQLQELVSGLVNSVEVPANLQRDQGERVVSEAREKAERLLEDVDRLMAQIKQQNG